MAEKAPSHVIPEATSISPAAKSPDSDVSPGTQPTPKPTSTDYFNNAPSPLHGAAQLVFAKDGHQRLRVDPTLSSGASTSTAPSTATSISTIGQDGSSESRRPSYNSDRPQVISRKSSTASVSFRSPRNPSLPQGLPRKTDKLRLRESSPEPIKFKQHVGFDNLAAGDATKNNASSLTLRSKHAGYQPSRRSRTFMVGVDEHAYSDYALVWLLNNMVDDGDEVVCVRVFENAPRSGEKGYQEDAKKLLKAIEAKNELNKAISIVLEYSIGKLHTTFQQLLQMYQPSMLIVGTKGRSLGGIQGLMNTRNSFSKYCLQYSPVPVVVVRPDEKRLKKKSKRTQDPSRQSYANMLQHNEGKHEADSMTPGLIELEKSISPDEEAHRVAAAIGLPAAFDPTIKANPRILSRRSSPAPTQSPAAQRTSSPLTRSAANDSGDDDSGDDDDEFEVEAVSAAQVTGAMERQAEVEREQKRRLHAMEVGEAAALLKMRKSSIVPEDDDDDDDALETPAAGKAKT